MTAYERGDYQMALRLWHPLADQGDADGQHNLGVMYRDGQGVNGGGIMLHARRPGGPVAAAQNCATHGPLSVATRGRRCTAWSSMRRFDWRLSTRV